MTKQEAKELLQRYRTGQCSLEEQKIIESWIEQELTIGKWDSTEEQKIVFGNTIKAKIDARLNFQSLAAIAAKPVYRRLWIKIGIAAAVLLIPGFFFVQQHHYWQGSPTQVYSAIAPGKNAATLTLADGKKILLTETASGKLASESGVRISKTAEGMVRYEIIAADSVKTGAALKYNTLTTALGQQYQVLLPDGTKVWLNNASSLKYPVCFNNTKKREVELTGEAYFEVAKNARHPFIVKTEQQEITVLGTHFNVNAYNNEPELKTTLLEGSIQINAKDLERVIKPGEQATWSNNQLKVKEIDTELAVAWKNNQFMFESEGIENIMRRIERWYNVKVEYSGEIPSDKFGGTVPRFGNVSELLNVLELTGKVHFKVEGRRIMVYK